MCTLKNGCKVIQKCNTETQRYRVFNLFYHKSLCLCISVFKNNRIFAP